MLLDFDAESTAFAAQPFWLLFSRKDGATQSHAPDFFALRRGGTALVLACRPELVVVAEEPGWSAVRMTEVGGLRDLLDGVTYLVGRSFVSER